MKSMILCLAMLVGAPLPLYSQPTVSVAPKTKTVRVLADSAAQAMRIATTSNYGYVAVSAYKIAKNSKVYVVTMVSKQ